jgi:hypothetical protein
VDALRRADIEAARTTPLEEKLAQAIELMEQGIALKRAQLRARNPEATEAEVDRLLAQWLEEPR